MIKTKDLSISKLRCVIYGYKAVDTRWKEVGPSPGSNLSAIPVSVPTIDNTVQDLLMSGWRRKLHGASGTEKTL